MSAFMKYVSMLLVAAAVFAAAISAYKYSSNMRLKAEADRDRAVAQENAAKEERKTQEALAKKAEEERRASENNIASQKLALEAAEKAKEESENNRIKAIEERKSKELASKAAEKALLASQAERDAAKSREAAAMAALEKSKADENALRLKADEARDKLQAEKLKSEKIIAEAKMAELSKIDFQTWERDLLELRAELEERERALEPEKTIADLSWVGDGQDNTFDENGRLTKKKKEKKQYRAEDDITLPRGSRILEKEMRMVSETQKKRDEDVRQKIIKTLEGLYVDALKESRVIDAKYYKDAIKSFYPDWKFKGEIK
jgi:hypothetical protein